MYLTVDQILKQVHRTYEGDVDYPEFEDEETQLYMAHLKDSIREWGNRFPNYREMFVYLADADDGDTTTTPGSNTINCPTNFVRPARS